MTIEQEVTAEERSAGLADYSISSYSEGRTTNEDGWEHDAWNVCVEHDGCPVWEGTYHCGIGHGGKAPQLEDVLYSLIADSDCLEYNGFEDWASCMGFDEDSRKAEKLYRDCCTQAREFLDGLCGPDELDRLRGLFQDY